MRKLNVNRKWSIIECGSRITLYVECPAEEATNKIDGKPFKAYPLKNGKTVSVEIGDEPTLVIVDSSTMSVSYTVPAGTDEVNLTAAPRYNPAQGNPFTIG